jgi:hypothetical protein
MYVPADTQDSMCAIDAVINRIDATKPPVDPPSSLPQLLTTVNSIVSPGDSPKTNTVFVVASRVYCY